MGESEQVAHLITDGREKMRTSQEVKDELEDIKRNSNATDGTEDILTGWVEALEWVLSEYKEGGE